MAKITGNDKDLEFLNSSLDPDAPRDARIDAIVNKLIPQVLKISKDVEHFPKALSESEKSLDGIRAGLADLYTDLRQAKEGQVSLQQQFEEIEKSLSTAQMRFTSSANDHHKKLLKEFDEKLSAAESAFTEQQAIREPVKLWETKLAEHAQAKRLNLRLFIAGLVGAAVFVCALMYVLAFKAAFVEILLAPIGCDPAVGGSACAGFSLKGTLLTAGVLTLFTLLLWFVRLQMKLFLAERYLALDARERQAFAQSYLGLVREGDVSEEAKEQRALVYAALFRPASDGTVRDEGGVDPSVAAAISKILMR